MSTTQDIFDIVYKEVKRDGFKLDDEIFGLISYFNDLHLVQEDEIEGCFHDIAKVYNLVIKDDST